MTPPRSRGNTGSGRSGGSRGGGPRPSEGGRPERPQRGSSGTTKKSQPTRVPRERATPEVDVHDPDGIRLQKLLAAAGVGSRRVCENLISDGRVEVDGHVVTELGVRIRPDQTVHVDGVKVQLDETRVYFAFNKPLNVVTTMNDELGRISIGDYVGDRHERLFHVGRLDADTEGLLILTNDGELAHRLQHPQYGVLKTYLAQIRGPATAVESPLVPASDAVTTPARAATPAVRAVAGSTRWCHRRSRRSPPRHRPPRSGRG